MRGELPDWYPLANASDAEIESWLMAECPPYDAMREALPWLNEPYQFDAWIEGMREARVRSGELGAPVFANICEIPLPPRRLAGRVDR